MISIEFDQPMVQFADGGRLRSMIAMADPENASVPFCGSRADLSCGGCRRFGASNSSTPPQLDLQTDALTRIHLCHSFCSERKRSE
jgi:hypothetical protein